MRDRTESTLALDAPATEVHLVSPARARALGDLGIETVRDLVSHYPRRYIDMSAVETIAGARIGESCSIRATVFEAKAKRPRKRLELSEITLNDGTGTLIVTAFRQPWLAKRLSRGTSVVVSGTIEFNYGYKRMTNPYIEELTSQDEQIGMILPVHPATGKIKVGMMRRLIANALDVVRGSVDPLPLQLRAKYRLPSRQNALAAIHFPSSLAYAHEARRRLVYEELLMLELALLEDAGKRSAGRIPSVHVCDGPLLAKLRAALPFALTADQQSAIEDVLSGMNEAHAMNHLVLGDVGTGKTIVAAFALAAAADSGTQAFFMAPTELLAQQHAASLGSLFDVVGISWALLTGSTPAAKRAEVLARLAAGELAVTIGTHALLQDDVVAKDCTLAIIDEQQRFGVGQRAALLAKGSCPDALYLTATPIPRSLALALFGNLTLSYLRQRPGAGGKRTTTVLTRQDRGVAFDAARAALARGEQVYIVCPLVGEEDPKPKGEDGRPNGDDEPYAFDSISIEEEADMDRDNLAAARDEADLLQSTVFADFRVGLVHGKLDAQEKQTVMEDFREGRIQVLVATTVIEVGIDVARATVMIVQDADRFGLAQLHQLRGRVGRGDLAGSIYLVSASKVPQALERLKAMECTEDGFELAEYDLSLRREGDILGNRQHGASGLKLVNITRDGKIIEAAHADALAILAEDPSLESEQYRALAREMRVTFKGAGTISGG